MSLALALSAHAYELETTHLGHLPGQTTSFGLGVNEAGHVCGASGNRAFFWSPGTGLVELPGLPGHADRIAHDLNDADVVAGTSGVDALGPQAARAVRWTAGQVESLGTLPGGSRSQGLSIDALGRVAGYGHYTQGGMEYWRPTWVDGDGGMEVLDGVTGGYAYDIAASGHVVGLTSGGGFRWSSLGGSELLPGPAGWTTSRALAVSDNGQWVAGSVLNATGSQSRFARWSEATGWQILGDYNNAGMTGINNQGDCVGTVPGIGAFLYTTEAGLRPLTDLLDPVAGWVVTSATDISDNGHITGGGVNPVTGESGALRLSPVGAGPVVVEDLSIQVLGSQVVLEWSPLDGALAYRVHASATPRFQPDAANLAAEVAQPGCTLALPGSQGFYRVVAVLP